MYPKSEDPDDIVATMKDELRNAHKHKGQDRSPKDPRVLMANHYAAIPQGKKHRNPDPSMTFIVQVDSPYLPCTKAFDDLQLMAISQLKCETHHRGKFLMVRQMGEHSRGPVHITAVVRDAHGSFEHLTFDTADIALPEKDIMPLHAVMVIKEPFYTSRRRLGEVICIDHPSDLVYVPITDTRVPLSLLTREESEWRQHRTALQWKEAGNAALKADRSLDAAAWYSCGILVASTSELELKKTLYRNRAQAHLKLKRFDAAEADALAALQGGEACQEVDHKAYFRAGLAAYSLRHYARAKQHTESLLTLKPGDRDGLHLLELVTARLHEQDTGLYDFANLTSKIRAGASRLDVADFINNTEVKISPGRGRGLFATIDLKPGDLVLCEKAITLSLQTDSDYFEGVDMCIREGYKGNGAGRKWKNAVITLFRNPSKIPALTDLVGRHEGVGKTLITVDGTTVVDMFQIHDIFWRNSYFCGLPNPAQPDTQFGFVGSDPRSPGIWPHASYINHSCLGNATRCTVGDLMLFHATRPIAKGEEITTEYVYEEDFETRHSNQKKAWGFECSCALCEIQSEETDQTKQKRKQLTQEAKMFLDSPDKTKLLLPAVCARAERLVADLMSTYDATLYQHIPRLAPIDLQALVALHYFITKQPSKLLAAVSTLFKLLAFEKVALTQTSVELRPGKNSLMHYSAAMPLGLVCQALTEAKKVQAAKKYETEYKKWYLVLNGVMDGSDG